MISPMIIFMPNHCTNQFGFQENFTTNVIANFALFEYDSTYLGCPSTLLCASFVR